MKLEAKCRRGTDGLRDGINRLTLRAETQHEEAVLKRIFEIVLDRGTAQLAETLGVEFVAPKGKTGRKS